MTLLTQCGKTGATDEGLILLSKSYEYNYDALLAIHTEKVTDRENVVTLILEIRHVEISESLHFMHKFLLLIWLCSSYLD